MPVLPHPLLHVPHPQVVLCFEERFWDSSVHLFGHVATSHTARGEFFLFWHLSEAPVREGGGGHVWVKEEEGLCGGKGGGTGKEGLLSIAHECLECTLLSQVLIALVAGEDAERFESLPDHVVLAKALAVLRSIFGDKAVPEVSRGCVHREGDSILQFLFI